MVPSQEDVTRLLRAVQEGEQGAVDKLFPLVYAQLHERAELQRRHWHGDFTLNTTALVHEAYIKLADQTQADWKSRAHFLSVAAKAMRHILIDYAKRRRAEKRGGDVQKFSLEGLEGRAAEVIMTEERADTLVALDEALQRLEEVSPRQARIVECRVFVGMTIEETAAVLDVSTATVKRGLAMAQAWLYAEMQME